MPIIVYLLRWTLLLLILLLLLFLMVLLSARRITIVHLRCDAIYNNEKVSVIAAPSDFHLSYLVNNNFYVNDMEQGLLRFAMGNLFPLKGTESLRGKEIWGILAQDNQLLISTASDGVFIYDGNSVIPWDTEVNEFLKRNQIYKIIIN